MIVDSMTKTTASVDYLLYILKQGQFIIVKEERSLQAKAKQKLQTKTNRLNHKVGCVKVQTIQTGSWQSFQ